MKQKQSTQIIHIDTV